MKVTINIAISHAPSDDAVPAIIKNDSCCICATIKKGIRLFFATFKKCSSGSFLAPSKAGNSRHVLGLLRSAPKGVK